MRDVESKVTSGDRRPSSDPLILVTGATGYVGGRLLKALEARGARLRCMARHPEHLASRVAPGTQVLPGDCLDAGSLRPALVGVETAFYLVHSMGSGADFERRDRAAARNFGAAARAAGVSRIVYLGGLGHEDHGLSPHLRSRQETGHVLRESGVPVIEFRAGIVLGSGSLSFELIRSLVDRLPVMVCPRWVRTPTQPIGVEDLITYLVLATELPAGTCQVFEIGGGEPVSYREIMLEYARQRGLRRWLIPVPLLTPYLSSLWLGLTTPLYARVGRTLIESLRSPTVVRNPTALEVFHVDPMDMPAAITRALQNEEQEFATTRWSDGISSSAVRHRPGTRRFGTRLVNSRTCVVPVPAAQAFGPIRRIGGRTGWYRFNMLWRLRGWIDLLFGGVGLRRGRRDPDHLAVGDALDCWRVDIYQPDTRLRLAAEMKLPGRAWLEFEVEPHGTSSSVIRQTAVFDPAGFLGLVYWYTVAPLHGLVFRGMLDGIAARAGAGGRSPTR
jgi:uncharacterized protein YbjT (DUF2867 family)